MNAKALVVAAVLGAAVLAVPASAAEPVTLNAAQLDQVSAGVFAIVFANTKTKSILFQKVYGLPTGSATGVWGPYTYGDFALIFGIGPN